MAVVTPVAPNVALALAEASGTGMMDGASAPPTELARTGAVPPPVPPKDKDLHAAAADVAVVPVLVLLLRQQTADNVRRTLIRRQSDCG